MEYIAIGNDELGELLGDSIKCHRCWKMHPIEQSLPSRTLDIFTGEWKEGPAGLLQFYKCGDATYIAGVNGRGVKFYVL